MHSTITVLRAARTFGYRALSKSSDVCLDTQREYIFKYPVPYAFGLSLVFFVHLTKWVPFDFGLEN